MYIIKEFSEFIEKENKTRRITFYNVVLHGSDFSDILYDGASKDDAMYNFNNPSIESKILLRSDLSIHLSEKNITYRFIGAGDIEDFPIEDYYDDTDEYEIIEEEEYDEIESKEIGNINKKSEEILDEVQDYFKSKYGSRKYSYIIIEKDNFCINLRIKNHTENIRNIDRFNKCKYHISVVISDYDVTKNIFWSNEFERRNGKEIELNFNSNSSVKEIIEEVEGVILDIIEEETD